GAAGAARARSRLQRTERPRGRKTAAVNKPFTATPIISLHGEHSVTNNERPRHRPPPDCRLHRRRPAGAPRGEGRVPDVRHRPRRPGRALGEVGPLLPPPPAPPPRRAPR